MSAGNPKGWPKSEMLNYGIPKPVFVIPAAYVNKQAAEWPSGYKLNPCVIPPPEVTLSGGTLTIHGTSINIFADIADIEVTVGFTTNLGAAVPPATVSSGSIVKYVYKVKNYGPATTTGVIFMIGTNAPVVSGASVTVIAAGAPVLAALTIADLMAGVTLPAMPAGSSYQFIFSVTTVAPGTLTANGYLTIGDKPDLVLANNQVLSSVQIS